MFTVGSAREKVIINIPPFPYEPMNSSRLATIVLVLLATQAGAGRADPAQPTRGTDARAYSVQALTRIADPVLTALSANRLKQTMPVRETGKGGRRRFTYLEALGRTMTGMAPWLELGPDETPEGKLRDHYIQLSVRSIANAVNPKAPDYMNFDAESQPLVDAAFLAQALLRAPKQLWGNLAEQDRSNLVRALKATRRIKPANNNWLLFSAMIEAALWQFTGECEMQPIQTAVAKHLDWYKGDGVYGDGPEFHWDYYNSYVIQPMLLEVLRVCADKKHPLGEKYGLILERARRYAAVEERLISPEGSFPILGRSSAYRFGAFQALSQIALLHLLPPTTKPGAVRAGLTAVIRRMIEAPGTFDSAGWLRIGAVGSQPSLAEDYISTGSLYLCTAGLLHLGLPPTDPFWTDPEEPWTQKRIWSGTDTKADHAIRN